MSINSVVEVTTAFADATSWSEHGFPDTTTWTASDKEEVSAEARHA